MRAPKLELFESAIFCGRIVCGVVRRTGEREFVATDRLGRRCGAAKTVRGAVAAIRRANLNPPTRRRAAGHF